MKNLMFAMAKLCVVILTMALCSCTSSPKTTFYTLTTIVEKENSLSNVDGQRKIIGVGPVEIPKLMDRDQIVTEDGMNQVHLAEFHQWGAPLNDNISRVVAQNLGALRSDDIVYAYPWAAYDLIEIRIVLNFLDIELSPGKRAALDANWAIINERNQKILKYGRSRVDRPLVAASYNEAIRGLSLALGQLSHELAQALQESAGTLRR